MPSPIPLGTLLRQRYLIQEVLGQGGFGRTYLALDQERFSEQCTLKEFTVFYQDEALVEKSGVLFQREASILYQIQHPQIPRFWAAFEDEQRLFLVQSFIEGQTYRQLLSERKQKGQAFSESEILHLLNYMLPVLTYIHDRDIIHRDISPENIILQTRPGKESEVEQFPGMGLPVLIDFGSVKEATSHWPLMTATITRVGKVGYAPPEQLQTGTVYPSSDLYALAATSMALLTGREPRSLLDGQTLAWNWQPYATLSDELAAILNKMLAVYPGDRYHSAREVWADLQSLIADPISSTILKPWSTRSKEQLPLVVSAEQDQASQLAKHNLCSSAELNSLQPTFPSRPAKKQRSLRLGQVTGMGIAITLLVALGVTIPEAWRSATVSSEPSEDVWMSGAKIPKSEASRFLDSQGGSNANSKETNPLSLNAQFGDRNASGKETRAPLRIQFPGGEVSTVVHGNLQNTTQQSYILKAAQGQIMTVALDGPGVVMNVLRENQEAVDTAAYRTRSWTGQLPADDHYLIQVMGSGSYSLDVAITPFSRPSQDQTQRVSFAKGATGTSVTGKLLPKQVRRYLLNAKRNQLLVVKVLQGGVKLSAIAPTGDRIGGSATNSKDWKGRLPVDGDYLIEASSTQAGDYALSLEIF